MPATLEERVAYLEGKIEEHSNVWKDLAERLDRVEKRIDALDQKLSRYSLWIIGIQVTILISILVALLKF